MSVEEALDFIRDELSLPDGRRLRETLPADEWVERDVLEPILATDDEGLPSNDMVYVELARGHWKTGGVAAISMVEALRSPGTQVYAVASDLDQARLLVEAMAGQCRRNASLGALFVQTRTEFRIPSTGSHIRVMSSDAPSFYGIGVDAQRLRIVCDEFGQWQARDLFDAALTTLPKVRNSQLVIITNAGVRGTWQEEVRASAEANGYYVFSAPGVIASWISAKDLQRLEATVPPPVFRRFYLNEWVDPEGEFVPMDLWDSAHDPCLRPLMPEDRTPVVLGVDAAVSGDCFAIVAVTRAPDRPQDAVAAREVRVWKPEGGSIDFAEPWDYLRGFCRRQYVVQVAYDPYQLHDFCMRFAKETAVWCLPFDQGAARAQADSDLFQLIRSGRLRHNGDPVLREHVANCGFKVAAHEDTKARLVKRGLGKIDAAVALSMAASEAQRLIL